MNTQLSLVKTTALACGAALLFVGIVLALSGVPATVYAETTVYQNLPLDSAPPWLVATDSITDTRVDDYDLSEVDKDKHAMANQAPLMPAATYQVTNTNASGPGSLYQTILSANANPGADTIAFAPNVSSTIVLTGSLPGITDTLTINGPGANLLAVSGANTDRVFYINTGVTVTISDLTIRDGNAGSVGGGIYNGGTLVLNHTAIVSNTAREGGGGIRNYGVLTMTDTTVSANSANYGGGILNYGVLTMTDTTVSANSANYGGGVENRGTLTLINSTFSGNQTQGSDSSSGGSALDQYYINKWPSTVLVNSTVVSNTASITNVTKSGIWLETGKLTIQNSIVAHNGVTNNVRIESGTVFTSLGYNLTNSGAGTPFTATTDLTNTNPLLGPLQDNGGATWTHALLPNSPAIDLIPLGVNGCGTTLTTDQRGQPRPGTYTHLCDTGAYEVQGIHYLIYLPVLRR